MHSTDFTHDPAARSWLAAAQAAGTDFPLQNLPFGVFRASGSGQPWRGGVAIGDQVLDLAALARLQLLDGLPAQALQAAAQATLNDFLALGPAAWRALRQALFGLLSHTAAGATVQALRCCLLPQDAVEHAVPMRIGDYTDFYTSYHHALNIGRLFNLGADVVAPNFHAMPLGYHGRVSSIGVSGQQVRRPLGQSKPPGAAAPVFGPCQWLDYELELGLVVGTGNAPGTPVPLQQAGQHLFGVCLLNDWSARDIQGWEMFPLGPFLAKNFATTISPWIVTMDALAPYRAPWQRDAAFAQPLPYLDGPAERAAGAIDIQLEVWLESASRRAAGAGAVRLTQTSFRHQHWTAAQMLAHHTVGGCNLQPGDLLGSGTISGPTALEAGAMMELAQAGRRPVRFEGGDGAPEERGFLADGDAVILQGWCAAPGFARIGFGRCVGTVLPAPALSAALGESG